MSGRGSRTSRNYPQEEVDEVLREVGCGKEEIGKIKNRAECEEMHFWGDVRAAREDCGHLLDRYMKKVRGIGEKLQDTVREVIQEAEGEMEEVHDDFMKKHADSVLQLFPNTTYLFHIPIK
jgi:hypothetical protein